MGLRETNRARTRRDVRRQALRLFAEQGFEATKVDQICRVSGISSATFYRRFRSKEDVLFNDEYDPFFEEAFIRRPEEETSGQVVRNVFMEFADKLLEAD